MVFSSLIFLGMFLPITLGLYYISKNNTYRNIILLIASLIFYAWGEPMLILVMLSSAFVGYLSAFGISKWRGTWKCKASLIAALVVDIGFLGLYKYAGFFVSNFNSLFGTAIKFEGFALPLGISFYTFQILSYVIDVYRKEAGLQKSFYKFLLYVSMFPQLVAGPIVRYVDIEKQINERKCTAEDFQYGVMRFVQGMFKKTVLANCAGSIVAALIGEDMGTLSTAGAWFGMVMYAFQIYFDFSAYSDMAIGMGRFFGFKFKENFDYPYTSKSITEFWRRWHMSLGTFFRDYVYIPLGGNRKHQLFNIAVVWFLTGFWHGASWNFIFWGVYYGIWLIFEKKVIFKFIEKIPGWIRLIYSNIIVLGGWILFYFTDLSKLKEFFRAAFGKNPGASDVVFKFQAMSHIWLILIMVICATPLIKIIAKKIRDKSPNLFTVLLVITVIAVMLMCFALLVKQSYNPFLYFRF
ncbi:MAG: MBOAT family protein [Clostridia bacterium]|nr:MBOAT family protein [Clostridia bacterium]